MMMTLTQLLYVSESLIEPADLAREAVAIVEQSVENNQQWGITGALIATTRHFAQYLEGSEASIDALLANLRADPRHTNLTVIQRAESAERRFPDWTMAYAGNTYFVSAHVSRLVELAPQSAVTASRGLLALMQDFTDPAHHPHRG
jgi:hypothetical protein